MASKRLFKVKIHIPTCSDRQDATLAGFAEKVLGARVIEHGEHSSGAANDEPNDVAHLKRILSAYEAALDRHAIVAITDSTGHIIHVNDMFCMISGYKREELIGRTHAVVNSGEHPRTFFTRMWKTISSGALWHDEICNRSKNGRLYWVDTTIVPLKSETGRVDGFISVRYDITHRKLDEARLNEEVERRRRVEMLLKDVIETVPDGIAAFDSDDRLILFNRAYTEQMAGVDTPFCEGMLLEDILSNALRDGRIRIPRKSEDAEASWLSNRLRDHRLARKTLLQPMADGRWLQIRERRSDSGFVVGTQTDITELKQKEEAVKFLAEHDPLTGLRNRAGFFENLEEAIAGSLKSKQPGLLIALDLDGFKAVNDTFGHAAGDTLLRTVADRIRSALRRTDTVVRLGGDEFSVIAPRIGNIETAQRFARRLLKAIQQPVLLSKRTITPRVSIGMVVFPRDGKTAACALKNADLALYQSKANGRGSISLFSRDIRNELERRQKMEKGLAACVAADRIEIALQPQFCLKTRQMTGFESLARWQYGGRHVSPADFIKLAEETGQIIGLGRNVLEKSLAFAAEARLRHAYCGTIAINVAGAQLKHPHFVTMLADAARRYGLAPRDIEIELTENILLDDVGLCIGRVLNELRSIGFRIALDDFGTGYASLVHLSRLTVDRIKIDRSFVAALNKDKAIDAIVQATVGLAHDLDMTVVAEGIEREDQVHRLNALGCDVAQGYLWSKPLSPTDAFARLETFAGAGPQLP
jgi:diguanylate cyclase (GGDEF)-like protein/PAS domain S-box-containing protein